MNQASATNETRVLLSDAVIGMVLAKDVFRDRDMLLLRKGHVLTKSLVERLKGNGVRAVYVMQEKQ